MDCSTPDFPVPPTSWSSPKFMSIESVMPSNHLILCRPLLLLPLNFPGNQGLFQWVSHLHQVAKIFELQIQHQSFQWIFRTGFISCAVQGTLKSSPAPQFKSINSSGLSLFYGPTLDIHTWVLERPELWLHRPLSAKWCLCFLIHYLGLSYFFFQGASFNFMAAVSVLSYFGVQENKICH